MSGPPEVWVEAMLWASKNGAPPPLNSKPGVWSGVLGDYVISINGHDEPLKDERGVELPRYGISIVAPKYLAAILLVDPSGGVGCAGMEADVLEAFRAANEVTP